MEKQYKVVLVDYDDDLFSPIGFEGELLSKANASWYVGQHRVEKEIVPVVRDADVVMVQSVRPLLRKSVITQMEKCRCIIRLGIGYDTVDVKAATQAGIMVCNIPLYCIDDVAEHSIGLMFDAVRHITLQDRWIRSGKWDRRGARPSRRVMGSTLGLVSYGRIARAVAQRAKGLGMKILAFDPYVTKEDMAANGVEKVELNELLSQSDIISVHTPLTGSTRHLLSKAQFSKIKHGAVIVNTSRGPVMDTNALIEALGEGRILAAGLDVMEEEPLPLDSPLRKYENVTLTPHVGACTDQSAEELYRTACDIAIDVLSGKWPATVVNPEVKSRLRTIK